MHLNKARNDSILHRVPHQVKGRYRAYNALAGAEIGIEEYEQISQICQSERELELMLVSKGVALEAIGMALAEFHGNLYYRFNVNMMRPVELLERVKRPFIDSVAWAPIEQEGAHISVVSHRLDQAMSQPAMSPSAIWQKKTIWMVTTAIEYAQHVDWLFTKHEIPSNSGADSNIDDIVSSLTHDEDESDAEAEKLIEVSPTEENEVVKIINKTVFDAYHRGVSDIHIEPTYRQHNKSSVLIRFRQDGEMARYTELPYRLRHAVASRLKILAGIDITERRLPQDGKIKMSIGSKELELRVATIAAASGRGGEDIVMRILAGSKPLSLDKMRFSAPNLQELQSAIAKPYGLFLVCGPTGSGKTTTLHSVLGYLNTPGVKIITAEDPVEITQEGLRQIQVNAKAGLGFERVMRSMLRLDPDIIMVGEMRDKETIKMGIEASLTGHLVFSTLHTNSAPESIIRLLDMGMDPFNFADALLGVLAQRLCKTLCSSCKETHEATEEEISGLVREYCHEMQNTVNFLFDKEAAIAAMRQSLIDTFGQQGKIMLSTPKEGGCEKCAGTGHKGQMALHELLVGSDRIKAAIQQSMRPAELLVIAMEEGMRTLKQDGIEKVLQGLSTIQDVRKVCIK